LVAGSFIRFGGQVRNNIALIDANGNVDTQFDPNANHEVTAMAIKSNGNIVIVGDFTFVGGQPRGYISQISSFGVVDPQYSPNANDVLKCVALQPDGKAWVGGLFTSISGQVRNHIGRLNNDGTLDAFASVSGRVTRPDGTGATNARVTLIDQNNVERQVITGRSGNYQFANVQTGQNYTVRATHRRFLFTQQTITVFGNLTNINFIAGQ